MAADPWAEFEDAPPATQALERLRLRGVGVSNGFRTEADVERIRRQGYRPAPDGPHNKGDGVDLTPGKSGLSMRQLEAGARREFGPSARILNEGHHVHVAVPGWGYAPDTTRDDPWDAFDDAPPRVAAQVRKRLAPRSQPQAPAARPVGVPTGRVHDGDTFGVSGGGNARLRGMDAFERNQQGRSPSGAPVPLGSLARTALEPFATPQGSVTPTGGSTYGRPVVTLDNGGDAGEAIVRQGYGLAAPEYLRDDPEAFARYMEAERLARVNRLGAHGNTYQPPESFRQGEPDPWEKPQPVAPGEKGTAVFWDEPTPFMGLRPEIEQGYSRIWMDPKSTPADALAYAKANGFKLDPKEVRETFAKRDSGKYAVVDKITYEKPPRLLTDPGDGRLGVTARGLADPFNMLDEMGGVVDAVGLTGGRENVWNSERRFGDILHNNIDQNRSILAHDEATHPYYRLGGQLASGVALPYGAGARMVPQLMRLGAAEGFAAGFGAGEGGMAERLPNAAAGTALGTAGGAVLGGGANALGIGWRAGKRLLGRGAEEASDNIPDAAREAAFEAAPVVNDGVQASGPTPASRSQPQGGVIGSAAMRSADGPELVGPAVRQRDYINTGNDPWAEFADAPFGATRNINERLSADEMARLAEDVDPRSVLPVEAPDEFAELGVRQITRGSPNPVRVRGPLDMTQAIRSMGGIRDDGGNLAHMGITNEPRRMDFGSNEQFLGRLVNNEDGLSPDEATFKLWEEGYFPEFQERPTPADLLDRLHAESTGAQRYFRPDDLEEVERFGSAQAERYAIDELRADGKLPVSDGNTIDLGGKLGNINLAHIERPQDVAALIDQVSKRVGGFDAATRGRITHDETRALAEELGLRPEQLLKRRQGQALNAEQLHATRALVQGSRQTVAQLARKAVGGADEDALTFRKAWLKHVALEEHAAGATAEAGRALSQMRMLAKAESAGAAAVRAYLKGAGGKESLETAAEAIVDLMEDPAKASHFMRESVKPRWRDKFNELWVNSLLSGPRTHVVNFVGNALTTTLSFPEQALTAAIGKVTRSADRAYFGEVGARAVGLADSSVEALRNMRRAFKTGEAVDETSKIDAVHQRAISGKLGHVLRTPTRALTAADEFWKTLLSSAEMRQLAYRQAMRETGGGDAFTARYESLLRAPPEGMVKQARAAARYYTFQKELGKAGSGVQAISNNWVAGKILLPFVRTPINLLKFAGERSVFGLAMPEVRAALKAGGRSRDEALAKITLGSGLSTAAVVATLEGRVTGSGPSDPRERAALLQAGWQPNSIRIGDQWVSYARFDPVSTLIGVAADFAEVGTWATTKEADAVAMNLGQSIAKNVTNKTWLSGLSDAFDVLSDPERYGKGYIQRLAGSAAVPAISSQAAQALDPHLRDARTIMDAIKRRVPVLSQSVPVRRDVWGDPVSSGDAVGPDILSPFYASTASNEPFRQEVARLRAPLSMPRRYLTIEGKRVDLSAQQYDELVQLSGQPAKKHLEEQIGSPAWRSMNDGERREFIKEALTDFREAGRAALLERHPELTGKPDQQPPVAPAAPPRTRRSAPANDPWGEFEDSG